MNRFQALFMGFAATAGATGIAAYNGVFNQPTPPAKIASAPAVAADPAKPSIITQVPKVETTATNENVKVDPSTPVIADAPKADPAAAPAVEVAKADPAATEVAKVDPAAPVAKVDPTAPAVKMNATVVAPAVAAVMAPLFDVLRAQADGSVIIAGKADKDSHVEVVSGADVLGSAKSEPNGDFAIIVSETLKPGDYQLVLRSTMPDGRVATSIQTATVSIPEKIDGPVLALVEEPGKPSRIITTPEKPLEVAAPSQAIPSADAPAASASATTEIAKPADTAAAPAVEVSIEAVEIEGDKIFIAGKAKGAATIRVFANDVLLGDTKPGEGDRFLAELTHAMPVGDYIIRAEGLAADGVTIVAKASVPFQRVAGDNMSADTTAPAEPAKPAGAASTTPAATPAVVAEVKKSVIIHRGDTLWQISRRVYGHGVRYSTIYLANKDAVADPNRIYPGQVMTLPAKTTEGEDADAAAIEKLNAATKG